MGFLAAIIFGLLAGAVAKLIMPGKDPGGCIITSLLGIVGGVVGQAIGQLVLGRAKSGGWDLVNFSLAVVGAIVLLFVYRLITGKK